MISFLSSTEHTRHGRASARSSHLLAARCNGVDWLRFVCAFASAPRSHSSCTMDSQPELAA